MILPLFLLLLGFGLQVSLHTTRPREVGLGFWRLVMVIAGLALALAACLAWDGKAVRALAAAAAGGATDPWPGVNAVLFAAYAVAVLLAAVPACLGRETAAPRALTAANAVGVAALAGFGWGLGATHGLPLGVTAAAIGSLLVSALVLGAVLGGMLLGHWYLVNPAMDIRNLQVYAGLIIGALALRLLLSVAVGAACLGPDFSYAGSRLEWLVEIDILILLVRAAFGLVGPLVLSGMIWHTVKLRATQPATGLLYACVVFVLAGELSGAWLLLTRRVPL